MKAVAASKADTVEAANAATLPSGQTVGEAVEELAIKIGEKLEVSAAAYFDGQTAVYLHRRASDLPPQVGVLVEYEGSDAIRRPQRRHADRRDAPAIRQPRRGAARAGGERTAHRRGNREGGGQA